MYQLSFVSVLAASDSGQVAFGLETFDAESNIAITLTATGINSTDSPQQIAEKMYLQFTTILTQLDLIVDSPTFSTQQSQAKFRLTRTEHVLCFFSQAQFELELTSNTANLELCIVPNPVWPTISEAIRIGNLIGQPFEDEEGIQLPNASISLLLQQICATIVSITNNNIVACTYLHSEGGFDTSSIFFNKIPVIDFDTPFIRRPFALQILSTYLNAVSKDNFYMIPQTGELRYRFAQYLVENYEAFGLNNEILVIYTAGYRSIPMQLKNLSVKLSAAVQVGVGQVSMLKGGTFAVELKSLTELIREETEVLRPFFLPPEIY